MRSTSTLRGTAAMALVAVLAASGIAACGAPATSPPGTGAPTASPAPAITPTPSVGATGARPVIVDTDLGADDITALAVLLRDPSVEVLAITVPRTGLVHCAAGMTILRNLLADLESPAVPIGCGHADAGTAAYPFPDAWRAAADAAYGIAFDPAPATSPAGDAVAVIADAVAAARAAPVIVALGPWTNLAAAFAADPGLVADVAGIHAMGGTLDAPGNVWSGDQPLAIPVEANFGADPAAVAAVLATAVPVTLVPLDATDDVTPAAFASALEADHAAGGADLVHEIYARNPDLAGSGQFLWDQTAAVALLDPAVATWDEATVRAVVDRPNAGQLARDPAGRRVRYAASADPDGVRAALLAALGRGGGRAHPFAIAGVLAVTWDGRTCAVTGPPASPGEYTIRFTNTTAEPAAVVVAGPKPPKTWPDLLAFAATYDGTAEPPSWLTIATALQVGASSTASADAAVPAGELGAICASGVAPNLAITPGLPFTVAAP